MNFDTLIKTTATPTLQIFPLDQVLHDAKIQRLEDELAEAGSVLLEMDDELKASRDKRAELISEKNNLNYKFVAFQRQAREVLIERIEELGGSTELNDILEEMGLDAYKRTVTVRGTITFEAEVEVDGSVAEYDLLCGSTYDGLDYSFGINAGYGSDGVTSVDVTAEHFEIDEVEEA